jgi:hypothetical protein
MLSIKPNGFPTNSLIASLIFFSLYEVLTSIFCLKLQNHFKNKTNVNIALIVVQ